MTEEAFGKQLFEAIQKQKGFSKSKIYKILSLQRLCPEVAALGQEGRIVESALVEISRISTPARQKLLAELVVENSLTVTETKLLSRLIRAAEEAPEKRANQIWDFYFDVQEEITQDKAFGKSLKATVKRYLDAIGSGEDLPEEMPDLAPIEDVEAEPTVDFERQLEAELEAEDDFEEEMEAMEAAEAEVDEDPFLPAEVSDSGFPDNVRMLPGVGIDVGTTNICASRVGESKDQIFFNLQRNAFLDVRTDPYTRKMLLKLGIDHIRIKDRMYVLGNPAFELANIFERNTRRPMKDGLISPQEEEALQIVSLLMGHVLDLPLEEDEICCYSVPADPIDADRNVIYHSGSLDVALRKLNYKPRPVVEGHAVVLAEMADVNYTGIGISGGGGMFNVCVAYSGMPALTFSTSRGGDWIDNNVSEAVGIPSTEAAGIKESGVNLAAPNGRVEEAIVIYYRNLINYTLTTIKEKFARAADMPTFNSPVPLVCAGGTSCIQGFIEVFEEELEKIDFPIPVSGVRLARDPLHTVSHGCLVAALQERYPPEELEQMKEADTLSAIRESKEELGSVGDVARNTSTGASIDAPDVDTAAEENEPDAEVPVVDESVAEELLPEIVSPPTDDPSVAEPQPLPIVGEEELAPAIDAEDPDVLAQSDAQEEFSLDDEDLPGVDLDRLMADDAAEAEVPAEESEEDEPDQDEPPQKRGDVNIPLIS
jgi:hypothetical protein